MLGTDEEIPYDRNRKANSNFRIVGCLVSLISVLFTQITLSMLPFFFPTLNVVVLLTLSVLLLVMMVGLGRFCKKIAGLKASAPAFVFYNIFFIWTVYILVIREVVSLMVDFIFNIEIMMLITGLFCIMSMDPGFVPSPASHFVQSHVGEVEAQEEESSVEHVAAVLRRVRYCRQCRKHVMGFDHHCPAFGNCIGHRNHGFFILLLVGFVISEASFVACASGTGSATSLNLDEYGWKTTGSRNFLVGTTLFCIIQVVWQAVFIMWHIYCACFNIKTDEWINWRKYPEFQIELVSHADQDVAEIQFKNPYDKGILINLHEFLTARY